MNTDFFGDISKQIIINGSVINTLNISSSEGEYVKILSTFKTHIDFQERDEELEELRTLLRESTHVLVVNGIGGLGKSTIVNALSLYDINQYKHLIWLNISQGLRESIISNDQIIINLNLTDKINKVKLFYDAEEQNNVIFEIIISAIREIKEESLFILDDANVDFENEFLSLRLLDNWKIVITSRMRFDNIKTYELPFLTSQKAINLFYFYSKCKINRDNNDIIQRIVSYVWMHTLSIEVLAKTIANSFDLTPYKIEGLLVENGLKEIPEYEIKTAYALEKTKQEKVVTTALKCLKIAFDLSNFEENKLSIQILKHFALLPSIPISYKILLEFSSFQSEKTHEFQNQLRRLVNSAWITETMEGLYMHPIIQECIRSSLKLDINNSIDFIVNLTRVIDTYQDVEIKNLTLYIAFSKNLITVFKESHRNKHYIKFSLTFCKLLNTIGYPKDVLEIIDTTILSDTSREYNLELWFEKAKALLIIARLDDTIEILNDILNNCKNLSLLQGEVLYHLGIVYKKKYDTTKNKDILFKALTYTEMSLDVFCKLSKVEKHISSSYILKAQLLRRNNLIDLSLDLYEKAKSIREIEYGENHFKTALVLLDLGVLYNENKDNENGIKNTKKAIDILTNYYGEDSIKLAVPYHNYAHCFYVDEEFGKALEYELRSFEILKNNVDSSDLRYQIAERKLNKIKEMIKSK